MAARPAVMAGWTKRDASCSEGGGSQAPSYWTMASARQELPCASLASAARMATSPPSRACCRKPLVSSCLSRSASVRRLCQGGGD